MSSPVKVSELPSRNLFIESPLPIERHLKLLFSQAERLTLFDIGACECEDTVRYARLFPQGHVFAVEALPENIPLAKQTLEHYRIKNATLIPTCLSDEKGVATFHVSSGSPEGIPDQHDWNFGNKSSSLYPSGKLNTSWLKFNRTIEVKTETLADLCRSLNLEKIDFIHMDVQGAELKVLNGAGGLLKATRVIWLEVENIELYEGQPLKPEIESFMAKQGFSKIMDTVAEVSGDQLYVRFDHIPFKRRVWFKLWRASFILPLPIKKALGTLVKKFVA